MKALSVAFSAKYICPICTALAFLVSLPHITRSQKSAPANIITANYKEAIPDTAASSETKPAGADSITSFVQAGLPEELRDMLSGLTPKGILLFRDEFQGVHDGVFGQSLRMVKIWYIDDHIIGYIIDQPLDAGTSARVLKKKINIPVTWCCTPAGTGHPEHCATSVSGLQGLSAGNGCTGWHIKLPLQTGLDNDTTATSKDASSATFSKTARRHGRKKNQISTEAPDALPVVAVKNEEP